MSAVIASTANLQFVDSKKPQILAYRNPHWKGGEIRKKDGRIMVRVFNSPTSENYIYRYRLVMEAHLGRQLKTTEVIHHINGCPWDDRIENLKLMDNREHSIMHRSGPLPWARLFNWCVRCGTEEVPHKGHGLCAYCYERLRVWKTRARL